MDPSRSRAERRGRRRSALETDLLAHAPDENHLMLERRAVQAPQRDELRSRADAVVERPARRAGPREADVLLRHGYRLPGADAPGPGFGARSGNHVDAERGRGVAGEARVTRQEDARDVALVRVHQRRLGLEQRRNESAPGLELERAVVADS